jgi:hypothetical protein
MAVNEFRAEALKIWQSVADGLLAEPTDPPSQHYLEALDFLQKVAKNILIADAQPSGSRAGSILTAVRLNGKVTKFEEEIYRIILLTNDFYPSNPKLAKRTGDSLVVHHMLNWAEKVESSEFSEYILKQGYNELLKVVRDVRMKRLAAPDTDTR